VTVSDSAVSDSGWRLFCRAVVGIILIVAARQEAGVDRYREIPARNVLLPLVSALQSVACMNDRNSRLMVLQTVSELLGRPLPVNEHPQTTLHLFSIVDACRRCPDGLRALLHALEFFEPGSLALEDVRRIIDQMAPLDSWSPEEQQKLFAMLAGIVVPDIVEVFRHVAGPAAPRLGEQTTYEEMVLALNTLNSGPDGIPRALVFVEHLASRVRPDLAMKLRDWVDRQAAKMHLLAELKEVRGQLAQLALPPPTRPRSIGYVVFLLQHEGPHGGTLRLSYWHQLDVSTGWHPERGTDFIGSLDAVQQHTAELVESVESEWAQYIPDIRVEFVLPMDLLNLDVDQWQWEVDTDLPQPLGTRLSVVVRSLERMRASKWHRYWYSRWAELESQVYSNGAIVAESGYWNRATDPDSLRELTFYFESHRDAVALVLSAPPLPDSFGELTVGLRAGLPVVVWHRGNCLDEEFRTTVRALLHAGRTAGHLLDRIRMTRAHAYADSGDAHVGSHLTVLWDDPKRVVVPDHPAPPEEVASA
jgi:vWA-MoxR associated protein C-terminal domain/vWA-MoxR associated protein middle region 0/Effector-associated domain 2